MRKGGRKGERKGGREGERERQREGGRRRRKGGRERGREGGERGRERERGGGGDRATSIVKGSTVSSPRGTSDRSVIHHTPLLLNLSLELAMQSTVKPCLATDYPTLLPKATKRCDLIAETVYKTSTESVSFMCKVCFIHKTTMACTALAQALLYMLYRSLHRISKADDR